MPWYAAHVVILFEFRDGQQDYYPIEENILLIEAADDQAGWREAERRGELYALDDPSERWNERPVRRRFAGVRRLVECVVGPVPDDEDRPELPYFGDPPERPSHGLEVTYSFYRIESKEDFDLFVDDESADITYVQLADPDEIDPDERGKVGPSNEYSRLQDAPPDDVP